MKKRKNRIALIDPVGVKAGMDHYDLLLLSGIKSDTCLVDLYSNFKLPAHEVNVNHVFFNTDVSKIKAISSNFFGFLKALRQSKQNHCDWIIVHVFRAGIFDLVTFAITRMMGFKLCAIVHDIESLDTVTLPFVRKTVIGKLPHLRIVHNDFCKKELLKSLPPFLEKTTHVIPHVNFRHLFSTYHDVPSALEKLKTNNELPQKIHPDIQLCLDENIPLFLFFGQIKKAKGLDVLLEAITQTTSKFKVIIAGKVRDENWERYEEIITVLNIKDRIIPVIRHITDEERDYLFSISLAIILPYTRIYQSGVLLMAMSFPKAVIASDLSPNAEIITSEENGLLFQSENTLELAQKINLLINNPTLSNTLSAVALKSIENRFNPAAIGKQFSDLLH